MEKQNINCFDNLQFFRVCAAFRLVTAESIAHLLDDAGVRDLVSLIRRYGDVLRVGAIEDTDAEPSEQEKARAAHLACVLAIDPTSTSSPGETSAAHLACVLAIDPTNPNIAPPPEIVVINPDDFGLFDPQENES